jgi:hypothetical protein
MIVFGLPAAVAENESMEGNFDPPSHITDMAAAHAYLQKLGYEYRDMTTTRSAPVVTSKPSGTDATAAEVVQTLLKEFSEGALRQVGPGEESPDELFLGQTLVNALESYDYPDMLEQVVVTLLEKSGIPDPIHSVFAWADRDEIESRLNKAAKRQLANVPAIKALPDLEQAKEWAETPPADLTGKEMDEIYRLAIRGKVPQIAAIGWCWDDDRKGGATEDELAWYCGYVGHDGRLMRDLYVPDQVFEGWFPEYRKATWNDYEPKDSSNYHTMPLPDEPYIEGVRAIITSRYADRGAVELPDMLEDAATPLAPLRTTAPTRTTASGFGHATGATSNIVTLKAYPAGHTGKAPPVTAPASPVTAPTSVNEGIDSRELWREYQLDINALTGHGITRAGYQVVNTTPAVVFALGFLDDAGGVVEVIPQNEVIKLFSEYRVECLDDGITYKVHRLFGQSVDDVEKVVRERLQDVNIFDAAC